MSWQVGMLANALIAVAYLAISLAIVRPLLRSDQLRSNRLGAATAAIFLTCAVHHGAHAVHMAMPFFGVDTTRGLAMREAWGWSLALWDVVGALVAIHYWTLRRTYGPLLHGAQLFEDVRARQQQALELNDSVLQGLVVARMAIDLGDTRRAADALDDAIGRAGHMITDLLADDPSSADLRRSVAALDDATGSGSGGR